MIGNIENTINHTVEGEVILLENNQTKIVDTLEVPNLQNQLVVLEKEVKRHETDNSDDSEFVDATQMNDNEGLQDTE